METAIHHSYQGMLMHPYLADFTLLEFSVSAVCCRVSHQLAEVLASALNPVLTMPTCQPTTICLWQLNTISQSGPFSKGLAALVAAAISCATEVIFQDKA